MSSITFRIWGAFLGNGFARAMRIVEQLSLVPLLLSAWGVERFGEWVALTSVAMFAGLANFGIGQSAYSDIIIQSAGGNRHAAARSLVTSIVLIAIISILATAILFIIVSVFDPSRYFLLRAFSPTEAFWTLLIIGFSVIVGFYVEPFSAVVGSVRGAGIPNFLFGICKAIEIGSIIVALQFSAGPIAVACIILCSVLLNVLGNLFFAIKLAPWLSFTWSEFDRTAIARIWRAAFGFFCISVCLNIISIQAPRIIIFHGYGAAALSIFTICMTYTRAARNLICIIPQSAQVEFGRMYASGNIVQLRNFIETVTAGTVALGATALSIGLLMSPILIPIWTHGNVSGPWDLLIVLTVVCIVGTYFDPLLISSIAMNQMTFVSLSYAIGLAIGIGCGLFLLPSIGLATFAGICLLPPELAGSFAGRRSVEKMVGRMDFARGALFLVQSTIPSILRR